ncbi:class F sortase [Streptomyces sp. NPDC086023]|uniref:class F sortase n=1 Tax=Streptomyces sp. NPDC086023 TaxID=3365746 RepID=UPI0037D6F09B
MDSSRKAAGRRRTDRLVALFAVLAVSVGAWVVTSGDGPHDGLPGPRARSGPAAGPLAAHRRLADDLAHSRGRRTPGPLRASAPLRLRIPALRIDAPVGSGGPAHPRVLSLHEAGPTPGERGSALVLGRTGTAALPGSFHRLAALRPGNRVHVVREDGSTATFTVEWVGGGTARAGGTSAWSRTGPERARLRARGGTGAGRGEGRARGPRLRLFGCAGAPPACRVAVKVVARLTHVSR